VKTWDENSVLESFMLRERKMKNILYTSDISSITIG
jgi:hypothetical protein